MKKSTVYLVSLILDYSYEDWDMMSDEEFVAVAYSDDETGVRSYELQDFADAFNAGKVNCALDFIRIVEVTEKQQ